MQGIFRPVIFLAFWLFLLWLVIVNGIGGYYQSGPEVEDLETSVAWNNNARALYESAFFEQDPAKKRALLNAAIQSNPANAFALLEYALVMSGDSTQRARVEKIVESIVTLRPSDGDVQAKVASFWLENGRWDKALALWNSALSLTTQYDSQLFPFFNSILEQLGLTNRALSQWVTSAGDWWVRYFGFLARQPDKLNLMEQLFQLRQQNPEKILLAERRILVQRLLEAREWDKAYLHWLNSLGEKERQQIGLVYNGSFESPVANYGFGWQLLQGPAFVETAYTIGVVGRKGLHLVFRGRSEHFHHVFQRVRLIPGRYLLKGKSRSLSLRSIKGLQWRIRCLGENMPAIARSGYFIGSSVWQPFQVQFEVPADCGVQELRLAVDGRNNVENRVQGELWFDELEIKRL